MAEGEVDFKHKLDRLLEHSGIKKELMKLIVELGFMIKAVSSIYGSYYTY